MNEIIKSVSSFVIKLLQTGLKPEYCFHDLNHTCEIVENVKQIGSNSGLSDDDLEVIVIAAWFHDTGYTRSYLNHEVISANIAEDFLKEQIYPSEKLKQVVNLILVTQIGSIPATLPEMIIKDADILNIGMEDFSGKSLALKQEIENISGITMETSEWERSTFEFISKNKFYTEYAKKNYNKQRKENIAKINNNISQSIS